jgi:hypothetical protein
MKSPHRFVSVGCSLPRSSKINCRAVPYETDLAKVMCLAAVPGGAGLLFALLSSGRADHVLQTLTEQFTESGGRIAASSPMAAQA